MSKPEIKPEGQVERPLVKFTKYAALKGVNLKTLVAKRQEASKAGKVAKADVKTYTGKIFKLLTKAKVGTDVSLDVAGRRVLLQQGSRTYLDPDLLLKAGVSAKIIKKCTVTKATAMSLRVIEPKEDDQDDDENIPF